MYNEYEGLKISGRNTITVFLLSSRDTNVYICTCDTMNIVYHYRSPKIFMITIITKCVKSTLMIQLYRPSWRS